MKHITPNMCSARAKIKTACALTATSEHPSDIQEGKVVVINSYDGVQLLVSEKTEKT